MISITTLYTMKVTYNSSINHWPMPYHWCTYELISTWSTNLSALVCNCGSVYIAYTVNSKGSIPGDSRGASKQVDPWLVWPWPVTSRWIPARTNRGHMDINCWGSRCIDQYCINRRLLLEVFLAQIMSNQASVASEPESLWNKTHEAVAAQWRDPSA